MNNLMRNSIEIAGKMEVVHLFGENETIDVSEIRAKFNGAKVFAANNSTLAYVVDGRFFVAPFTRTLFKTLIDEGFKEEAFYVPFSNGDYPKDLSMRWFELRELAQISYRKDYVDDVTKFCDKNGIGELKPETLANCFIMPTNGVEVSLHGYRQTYFPICNESCMDCTVTANVGTYYGNNGVVVFVYRDGRTYVHRGYKILNELHAAGYREEGQFVPFSNGEEIKDDGLRESWLKLRKF